MIRLLFRLGFPIGMFMYVYGGGNSVMGDVNDVGQDVLNWALVKINLPVYVNSLAIYASTNGRLPNDLPEWLNANFSSQGGNDMSIDPWGNEYILERDGSEQFYIVSCGADEEYDTQDDIYAGAKIIDMR